MYVSSQFRWYHVIAIVGDDEDVIYRINRTVIIMRVVMFIIKVIMYIMNCDNRITVMMHWCSLVYTVKLA